MNILFITDHDAEPTSGGIDRTVTVSSQLLSKYGYRCYLAYFNTTENRQTAPFEDRFHIEKENFTAQFTGIIAKNQINHIIVSTAAKQNTRFILPAVRQSAGAIPVYFWYHCMPGYELVPMDLNVAFYRLFHNPRKLQTLKKIIISALSFMRPVMKLMLRRKYSYYSRYADRIIVLSRPSRLSFARLAGVSKNKVSFINNTLTYGYPVDEYTIRRKTKTVLIVARIDEDSKRIALALKIWRQIENKKELSDWKLFIVGSGEDKNYCRCLARKLKLQNCHFEGRKNPLEYYKRSSIYLMTSSNEGFSMTLLESQQMGVVPVAFDSFDTVRILIQNGYSGFIIPEKDIKTYVHQLSRLMTNWEKRQTMAKNAVENSKRFRQEKIIEQWKITLCH
ncbi:MAG: glycosyltransferase [Dysgonamonadaceae bacterium]|jgi:glycosyltransferase involved in cell wall biosynthesis|nr:glycosyltransferase [Dysgonamonadaceae bacterium]